MLDPLTHLGSAICWGGGYEPILSGADRRILRPGDVFVNIEPHPQSAELNALNADLVGVSIITVHRHAIADVE